MNCCGHAEHMHRANMPTQAIKLDAAVPCFVLGCGCTALVDAERRA